MGGLITTLMWEIGSYYIREACPIFRLSADLRQNGAVIALLVMGIYVKSYYALWSQFSAQLHSIMWEQSCPIPNYSLGKSSSVSIRKVAGPDENDGRYLTDDGYQRFRF